MESFRLFFFFLTLGGRAFEFVVLPRSDRFTPR